jgi:hypothetical protein
VVGKIMIDYTTHRYLDYMPTDEELKPLGKEGWKPWHIERDDRRQNRDCSGISLTGHVTITVRFYRETK